MIRSSSPHIRTRNSKHKIMFMVLMALLPATASGIFYFGLPAALIIITSLVTGIIADLIMRFFIKQKGFNLSAIVTSLLLALIMPPTVPLWVPAVGTMVAIILGKYAFGISNNIFNPALIGRAFLVISWPVLMTTWVYDGVTSATPLAIAKTGIQSALSQFSLASLFLGRTGGCIGETSAAALLLGAGILVAYRIIDWKIPLLFVGTVAIFTIPNSLFHVLSGGLLLGAIFMATDYITIPLTSKGRMIFAIGCGLLTVIFRLFSAMPEGVMYSILLMNAISPLIDRLTKPKPFGK